MIEFNASVAYQSPMPPNCVSYPKFLKAPIVKNVPTPLIISIKHVIQIENCSRNTASRRIKIVWESLGKKEHQKITVQEYVEYYAYDLADILQRIS
ncbi:MAG: hypothetical protein V4722_04385 [Bacteroidota bacterium]